MKIRRRKIDYIHAERKKVGPMEGLRVSIQFEGMKVSKNEMEIKFVYRAFYDKDMAVIMIKGTVWGEEDEKFAKLVAAKWKESKFLPVDFARELINGVNFVCGSEAILIALPLGLKPPMFPIKVSAKTAAYVPRSEAEFTPSAG